MSEFVQVARLSELPPGERKAVWVSGVRVLLVNLGGEIAAVDEQCTHMECSLLAAPMRENLIICPRHLAAFDLRSGKVLRGPATVDLPTWNVKVEGDAILVQERPVEMV
ncbi:MAG: Rieske 2Fe-2S domain-containing protein [Chloroflexota bacterium]